MEYNRQLLTKAQDVIDLANRLDNYPHVGLDTESSGPLLIDLPKSKSMVNMYRATLTGISLALPDKTSYYVPIGHTRDNASLWAAAQLRKAIEQYAGIMPIHNLKHELQALDNGVPARSACTQVLMWLLQIDDGKGKYGLKSLVKSRFGRDMATFEDTTGGSSFDQLPPSLGLSYAAQDAEEALELWLKYSPAMASYKGMEDTYWNVEMPFVRVLRDMEEAGFDIDREALRNHLTVFGAAEAEAHARWEALCPGVNPNSSKQLQALYTEGDWSTKGVPKKATGFSTEKEWVAHQLLVCKPGSKGYLAAQARLDISLYSKLISTYGEKLLDKADQYPDFRLHAGYLHTGTATGRLSSSYPNLQNIPVRTKEGKAIRDAFISPWGWSLVSADYSQIELRVLAHFCKKGALYEGYRAGADVHQAVADELGTTRDNGKTTNFATVYGAGAKKLARVLGMDLEECKDFLSRYKKARPEVFETMDRAIQASRRGYVRTLLGRIRRVRTVSTRDRLEELKSEGHRYNNSDEYQEAWRELGSEERKAANTPIQGGARDIVTLGMIKFHRLMDKSRCAIIGQVHDDVVTRMSDDYVEEGSRLLKDCLESAYSIGVPLVAEPAIGKKWSDLK